jgi:hypothetical protein
VDGLAAGRHAPRGGRGRAAGSQCERHHAGGSQRVFQ